MNASLLSGDWADGDASPILASQSLLKTYISASVSPRSLINGVSSYYNHSMTSSSDGRAPAVALLAPLR